MMERMRRRDFLKRGAAGLLIGSLRMRRIDVLAQNQEHPVPSAPSDRIVLGFIGMGRMGQSNLKTFRMHPEVQFGAVCDVYAPNLDAALKITEGKAKALKDFRQLLEMKELDAVVICTPDHWHPLQTIMACEAGKDVYVEKPISVYLGEGRRMVEIARKYKRIVQVGTQQRSGVHFQRAVELIRKGHIGKVSLVRTWNYGNAFPDGIGNPPDSTPPQDLDWDLWLGPARKVPFNPNRFGVHPDRWSSFRWFWDYAGGMMTDWGVHLLDIVHWAMDVDAPQSVSAQGGKFCLLDNRETPDTLQVTYQYPGFICIYESRECNQYGLNQHRYGISFHGTEGTLFLDRGGLEIIPEQTEKGAERCEAITVKNSNHHNQDHSRNFLNCIKTRQTPISDIEIGHRSTSAAQLGNIALRSKSTVVWDRGSERVKANKEAARYLAPKYRRPWKLA